MHKPPKMANTPMESFIAGSVSGMSAIAICHPFDVVRTKIQLSKSSEGTLHVVRRMISQRGLIALYDGFFLPFCAQSAYKAIVFSTNTLSAAYLFKNRKDSYADFISGLIAGVVNSALVAPVELIRTKQIVGTSNGKIPIFQCILSIHRENGLRGFWKGFIPAALRDGPGVGFFLLAFNSCKNLSRHFDTKGREVWSKSPVVKLLSGAAAGIAFWTWYENIFASSSAKKELILISGHCLLIL